MGIFDSIGSANPAASTIDPKRLFRALPKPKGSRFKFPHDIQTEVWNQWFIRRNEPDLILKMNTGSGKTVVGLVIARSSLNEDNGPAAYLVPNTQLQSQVAETADALGIQWTDNPRDPTFRQGEAVLICTIHTMYNGLTRFGLEGRGQPMDVGTVVIDDAHACIPIIAEQFSMTLPKDSKAYKRLFAVFSDVLKAQSLSGWTAITKEEGTQAVPVPYWAWRKELADSYASLDAVTEEESKDHKFVWPLIQNQLALCDVAFSPSEVEIRLPYPDLSVVPSFARARRRIYMTATLADDGVLITQMGVDARCVTNPIAPASASDIGDRIILTPVETSRAVSGDDVKKAAAKWGKTHNVVVIVPSSFRAKEWAAYSKQIHEKKTIEGAVKKLTSGTHLGVVVLVARYDGLDLPGDACRILVIDGLPERYSPVERVEAAAIGDTDAMTAQQTQRIEQGMGRGVRATDDYCAVLLLDPRLVGRLYTAADRAQLSPGTRAQYELSMEISKMGRGEPMSFFEEAVDSFLKRDPKWVNESRARVDGLTYASASTIDPLLEAERDAYKEVRAGRFREAAVRLSTEAAKVTEPRYRAWLKQRAAAYLDLADPAAAREAQVRARLDSNYILKVASSAPTKKLTEFASQVKAAVKHASVAYPSSRDFEVAIDSLLLDLVPSTAKGSHKRFETAMNTLGLVLGFNASRPDAETGIGPDNLWAVGGGRFFVIECKSEAVSAQISRDDLEQLTHSVDWFEERYNSANFSYRAVLIHPSRTPFWDAVPRQGAKIMNFDRLEKLREAVKGYGAAVADAEGYLDQERVGASLVQFGLTPALLEERWMQKFNEPAPKKGNHW